MKNKYLRFCTLLLLAAILLAGCSVCSNTTANVPGNSLYQRVMQTGTIRCGYAMFPPYCVKDPNTGKLSGIFVEILEEAGKNLGLKINWSEEVGWGSIIQGLETNRYDLVPTGVWPNANRGKHASFSTPLFYNGFNVYVRANDNRFTNNLQSINSESVTIATIDGYHVQDIAKNRFPHAHRLTHPDMCDGGQVFLDVITNKADVTFADPSLAALFLKNNPGTIKNIAKKPISIEANTMMFKIGESAFKSMLDTALTELINTGYVDKVLNKYEPKPGVYYRVSLPYQTGSFKG
jgi:polar amino acid transport system substrate-binding protein